MLGTNSKPSRSNAQSKNGSGTGPNLGRPLKGSELSSSNGHNSKMSFHHLESLKLDGHNPKVDFHPLEGANCAAPLSYFSPESKIKPP